MNKVFLSGLAIASILNFLSIKKVNAELETHQFYVNGKGIEVISDTCPERNFKQTKFICLQLESTKKIDSATLYLSIKDARNIWHEKVCLFSNIEPHRTYERSCGTVSTSPYYHEYADIHISVEYQEGY